MFDMIALLEEDFRIEFLQYQYQVSEKKYDELKSEFAQNSTLGQIEKAVVKVEKEFLLTHFFLGSKELDKLRNVSIVITKNTVAYAPLDNEVNFESLVIGDRPVMLSQLNNGIFNMVSQVNGIGYSITADPRGDVANMVYIAEKVSSLLETYNVE